MTWFLFDIDIMSPSLAVFIMMNNYFHDVATAMLVACAIAMRVLLLGYEGNKGPDTKAFFLRLYQGISKIVIASVIWIAAGGALRILTLSSYEWKNAVDKGHTPGLIAKYIIALAMVVAGSFLWISLRKRANKIINNNVF